MTILTLFLVLNPAAVAAIWLAYQGRSNRRGLWELALAAAMVSSLGLLLSVVAVVPLLDALNVSNATFRIAAGSIVLFGAGQAFLGFGLRHSFATDTWLFVGLLVWLLSPPQLAAAAAVRVDDDIAAGLAISIIAATLTVLLAYVWMTSLGGRYRILLDWIRRILAAGAAIGGVELIRQGVLSV